MSKTVFIIDDDLLFRLISEKMISNFDRSLNFVHCENGLEGLNKLKLHNKDESEIIILLDLNMPVLDGWGFLEAIQSNQLEASHHISFYILSSSTDQSDLIKSKQYHFVKGFYEKPLSKINVIEILAGS
ncbi:response regulator [Belliella aquatica]|uniref:Response regulator n=1 Tax=Belliella aquatica TaxID=1323734 RepID=A0ABQ1N3E6_9BACT|nr:response regulator [Belliella aquatica]GGC51865.1 response regulator [Belliella aquatica]